jgi:1-acyl-sn-glycerol-3-phosphate acyltransferase
MQRHLATVWTVAEFVACSTGFVPLLGAIHLRHKDDPTHRVAGRWLRNFGKTTSYLSPLWDFSVEGAPPADITRRAYVVVSNHESNADPFLLSWLPWDMRWIAKEELFKVPFFGRLLGWGGDISLRRAEKSSVLEMLEECRRTLKGGLSIMMFPEGTRSRDGHLRPFKDGAFQLAIETGAPILPVAIAGTRSCLPTGSVVMGEARAAARVLEPIETAHLTLDDLPALREQTRERIAKAAAELRDKLGVAPPAVVVPGAESAPKKALLKWSLLSNLL